MVSDGDGASTPTTTQPNRPPNSNGPQTDLNGPIVIEDDDDPAPSAGAGQTGKSAEPRKQSIWTQEMKDTFGQLLDNYQDMVELNKRLV